MELIPAIDLLGGRVVRLAEGDYARATDYGDPFDAARRWIGAGATRLHLVDLDGAREGRPIQADLVARIVRRAGVPCQVAGGLRELAAVDAALAAGADRVVLGSALLRSPVLAKEIVSRRGPARLVAAIDVRDGRALGGGWMAHEGPSATALVRTLASAGVTMFAVTAIARDGLLGGPDLDLLEEISGLVGADRVIASAGVSTVEHVRALAERGYAGAILGRAIYEGVLSLAAAAAALGRA